MPYIDANAKQQLRAGSPPASAGELTYAFQQEINRFLGRHPNYDTMAAVLGALEGCKADFIARVLTPYERTKREQNGDVWGSFYE